MRRNHKFSIKIKMVALIPTGRTEPLSEKSVTKTCWNSRPARDLTWVRAAFLMTCMVVTVLSQLQVAQLPSGVFGWWDKAQYAFDFLFWVFWDAEHIPRFRY